MQTNYQVYFFSQAQHPVLEILDTVGGQHRTPFIKAGPGRGLAEVKWLAKGTLPQGEDSQTGWHFRIDLGNETFDSPGQGEFYHTCLRTLWVQDGQIFAYPPSPKISSSQVEKIENFTGSMPTRDLYVYLPRGYTERTAHYYPLLFMHDGQNCFEAFAGDSFAGSWQADKVADRLISQGRMRECIIVGVSHGGEARIEEYLPSYVRYHPPSPSVYKQAQRKGVHLKPKPIVGLAGQMAAYYRYEIAPYIRQQYRVLSGREHTATCGSSMGGVFTTYLAWERAEFARHHAALSPAYWITKTHLGKLEMIERLRSGEPRDIRLWLDSGTLDAPGRGDDGQWDTLAARNAFLANGYKEGPNFRYYLAEGATHSEEAWAARLDLVFQFLFPIKGDQ